MTRARAPMPKILAADPDARPAYLAGEWDYARGRNAREHPQYTRARERARRGKSPFDAGWIRTWADVEAVLEGCRFDQAAAARVVKYFSLLRHYKGRQWAGRPFMLLDFQKYDIIMPLFGWKKPDGTRRYGRGSVWLPKKNGKTTLFSGIIGWMLALDGEAGPEVYSAAVDRDQAARLYRDFKAMVRRSPELASSGMFRFLDGVKTAHCRETDGIYRALSADANKSEGLDIYCLLFDEIHALKSPDLWRVTFHGDVARPQSLFMAISTAGDYAPESVGYSEWDYARRVRDGELVDIHYFAYVAGAGDDDDPGDPAVWRRANPAWGVTVREEEMARKWARAREKPDELPEFDRYRLNRWSRAAAKFIAIDAWRERCGGALDMAALAGRRCWGGLDLSATTDLTALCWVFEPDAEGRVAALWRYWLPEETLREAARRDHAPYDIWASQGYIELSPGATIDYRLVRDRIVEDAKRYQVVDIGFDRYNAAAIMLDLRDTYGIEVVEFPQTTLSYNAPLKHLQGLIADGKLRHGDHPVSTWMAGNLIVVKDGNGNIKPSKAKSIQRIDGMSALAMALGRMIAASETAGSVATYYVL